MFDSIAAIASSAALIPLRATEFRLTDMVSRDAGFGEQSLRDAIHFDDCVTQRGQRGTHRGKVLMRTRQRPFRQLCIKQLDFSFDALETGGSAQLARQR